VLVFSNERFFTYLLESRNKKPQSPLQAKGLRTKTSAKQCVTMTFLDSSVKRLGRSMDSYPTWSNQATSRRGVQNKKDILPNLDEMPLISVLPPTRSG
jgi:hypothetical protein